MEKNKAGGKEYEEGVIVFTSGGQESPPRR